MISSNKQSGMTFIGLLMVLGMIGFAALVVLKVFPLYVENGSVNAALDSLLEGDVGTKGIKAMKKQVGNQFYVNDVSNVSIDDDIHFEQSEDGSSWVVTADYEGRATLFGNIGVFVEFSRSVEVPK